MSLTNENEKQNRISIADVQIFHEYKHLPHLSTMNQFLVEFTYILRAFYHLLKFGIACALVQRCLRSSSSWTKLQTKLFFLKVIFVQNGYLKSFIIKC